MTARGGDTMTNRQKFLIAALCLAPVIIGVWLVLADPSSRSAPFSFKKVGLVQVNGVILASDPVVKQLRRFREDDAIAGVLLRIDSPGGASAPSQEIFHEVAKFRDINKPLVVSVGNMAASGGYYIASPAMKIFANPSSITGSIGAIVEFPQYYKLLDKIGVSLQVIKAGNFKDMGGPQREMTPQDRALMQAIVSDIHEQFIQDVCAARSIKAGSLRPIADGRIMTGAQAIKAGLIDTLGSYEDALAYLKTYCRVPLKTAVVEKKRNESFLRTLIFGELSRRFPFLTTTSFPAGPYFLFQGGL
jgi:protease-4